MKMVANKGVLYIKDLAYFKKIQSKYNLNVVCTEDTLLLFNNKNVVYFCDFIQEFRLTIGLLNWSSCKLVTALWELTDKFQYDDEKGFKKAQDIRDIVMNDPIFPKIQLLSDPVIDELLFPKLDELLFSLAFLNEKAHAIFTLNESDLFERYNIDLRDKYKKTLELNCYSL